MLIDLDEWYFEEKEDIERKFVKEIQRNSK